MKLTIPNDTPLEALHHGLAAMNLEVSKIKTSDDGIAIITQHKEADNLHPLPVNSRWAIIGTDRESRGPQQ